MNKKSNNNKIIQVNILINYKKYIQHKITLKTNLNLESKNFKNAQSFMRIIYLRRVHLTILMNKIPIYLIIHKLTINKKYI